MPAQSGNDVRHHIYISQAMRKQDKRLHLLLKNLLASVEWRDGSCSLSGWRYGWLGSLHPSVGDKGGGQVAPGVGAVHCRLFRRVCVCVYSRITSSHDDEEPSLRLGSLPRLRVMVKKEDALPADTHGRDPRKGARQASKTIGTRQADVVFAFFWRRPSNLFPSRTRAYR